MVAIPRKLACACLSLCGCCLIVHTAEAQMSVLAGLWPWPNGKLSASGGPIVVNRNFSFDTQACPRLVHAFRRYSKLIGFFDAGEAPSSSLSRLLVEIDDPSSCERVPAFGDNESYVLELTPTQARLRCREFSGAIRGLETFSQIVNCESDRCIINASNVRIADSPRFGWRGVMLDSARHFLPVDVVLKMLDAMAYNKLNVLHWHITDDQSFPLLTSSYPHLAKGAYDPELTYSAADVARVVSYASERAIRIVPEFDSPGHASSWAVGYPELAIPECRTLDPTSEATFQMLEAFVSEVVSLFPDTHIHLGCDEVSFSCWNSSSRVTAWMLANGIPRTDLGFKHLTARYIGRLQKIAKSHGRVSVVWQEAMDHYGNTSEVPTPPSSELASDMIVEQWLSPVWNWANLSSITGHSYAGRNVTWPKSFRALTTNGWYLDNTAVNSWDQVYIMEPLTNASCSYGHGAHSMGTCTCQCPEGRWRDGRCHCFDLRGSHFADLVLGGEAAIWGEHIDEQNLFPRAFPRLSAVAERLWSSMKVNNVTMATPRLELHRCRLVERGIEVTPLGPGFCRRKRPRIQISAWV